MSKHKETCESVIMDTLQANPTQWIKKVDLFNIAYEKGGYSPETTCPILRQLERDGKIKKGTYDGKYRKNLIQYSLNGELPKKPEYKEIIINGERRMKLV